MNKLLMALLIFVSMFSQAQTFYYDEPAIITGKLLRIKSLHPNQEVFGGNQIALTLDQQINVDGDEGLVKTKLIQLLDYDDARYSSLFKKEGKSVEIKCSELFRSHTAHHTTKVLCVVKSVDYK
ncbi:DUF4431 domain-containing protein [Acinetobacter johnsonii]|jgi:hypothetical protein|uniref:DUF4431 domain-containing protein n=1 Tax=Acinetobacter johnsonii TaxID=40214 RepID=A0AA43BMQ0_ACIJO|nr:DUF4431 domain-containing protein [Acinetobacter johnsonii]MDH0836837.1 DUF4431 domain-containing protein [Acinetobacter johnsonii]MDH0840377.1 DUF4431 domain-containing protein [Acinetobacter johnsonii]MDH2173907.1 DUF4431 domain-containing protein [Acinetobacter johnsonii]MDH2177080.1 DUF4431 domain-containing protein [Acinetobacter johnsonii]